MENPEDEPQKENPKKEEKSEEICLTNEQIKKRLLEYWKNLNILK
jgi:hypothetical protein